MGIIILLSPQQKRAERKQQQKPTTNKSLHIIRFISYANPSVDGQVLCNLGSKLFFKTPSSPIHTISITTLKPNQSDKTQHFLIKII